MRAASPGWTSPGQDRRAWRSWRSMPMAAVAKSSRPRYREALMMTRPELLLGIILSVAGGTSLAAQQPESGRVTQAAGPRYQAGGLHRFLFGREYRSLWTTPVSLPLLDLRRFAGGLKPVSKGGGQQTKSLLLQAADGR